MFEYLFQSMQRRISCNTFSLRSIRTFWSSIWSSTVEVPFIFIDLCRFSRVDVPSSGPENVPKPGLPPFKSPRSAVSSTCKEIITWEIRGTNAMEVCALPSSLQAWLRHDVVWNCALGKWMQNDANGNVITMRQVSQDRYESQRKKQLLYIWSLGTGPTHEGTPLYRNNIQGGEWDVIHSRPRALRPRNGARKQ